jgi:nicotinamide mononucleotide adenylyltransferase
VEFLEMRDLPSDEEWTKQLLEKTGPVDIVWTGNEDTKKCFEGKVPEIKMIKEVPGISATEVRARMRGGGDWKALVPPEIIATMNAIDGVKKVVG